MADRAAIRTGTAMASTELTFPPVAEENTSPATAIMGARMPMRSSMERKFCTLVMSEVLRVTRLAVPKRSISAEEKVCTLSNTRSRSWEANWVEMPEASRTEPRLIRQENTVMTAMMTVRTPIVERDCTATPLLIIRAKRAGSIICPIADSSTRTDSPATCLPLSVTLEKIVFIGCLFASLMWNDGIRRPRPDAFFAVWGAGSLYSSGTPVLHWYHHKPSCNRTVKGGFLCWISGRSCSPSASLRPSTA